MLVGTAAICYIALLLYQHSDLHDIPLKKLMFSHLHLALSLGGAAR